MLLVCVPITVLNLAPVVCDRCSFSKDMPPVLTHLSGLVWVSWISQSYIIKTARETTVDDSLTTRCLLPSSFKCSICIFSSHTEYAWTFVHKALTAS